MIKRKICPKCKRELIGRIVLSGNIIYQHEFVTYEALNIYRCDYMEIIKPK